MVRRVAARKTREGGLSVHAAQRVFRLGNSLGAGGTGCDAFLHFLPSIYPYKEGAERK